VTASKRKLGEPVPITLVLNNKGILYMANGSDLQAYLKSVMEVWGKSDDLLVSIMPRNTLMDLETDALLFRSLGA
jgi:hypothetical protein